MHEDEKWCSRCEAWWPRTTDFFYPEPKRRDGLAVYCKACVRKKVRQWYEANKDRARAWVEANRDHVRAYHRTYSKLHPDLYRRANKTPEAVEYARARWRRWRERNLEHRRAAVREGMRRYNRSEKGRAASRRWQARHPEQARLLSRVKNHKRRARAYGTSGTWTGQDWIDLCEKYGNRCLCCGSDGPLTVDHVIPLEVGGTNELSNLQPLCLVCNSRKGVQSIDYRPLYRRVSQLGLFGETEQDNK